MKKINQERDVLKTVIKDLDEELHVLRSSKKRIEERLSSDLSQLDSVKSQEIKYRNLISEAMKKEATLLKKRNNAKDKLEELNKKIDKIKSIEREMEDV